MSEPKETLVAVVVTYNRLNQLQTTLARLLESSPSDLAAVVVVDNAATDGTGAWLAAQQDPRLVVQRMEANRGGAGGFAAGMALARARFDPDWIVVMDDDARPAPGALATFHAHDKTGLHGIAAAVYFPDGRICEMNRPWVNPFWSRAAFWRTFRGGGRMGFHLPDSAYSTPTPCHIDGAAFVGLFLSRAALDLGGLPDGGLFIYGDDAIYTLELSRAGGRLAFVPDLRFEHDCRTFNQEGARIYTPLWKVYYTYRNGLLLYRRAAGWLFWLLVPLVVGKWALAGRHYGADRRVFYGLFARAVRDGLLGRTDVSHDRVKAWAARP